MSLVNQFLWILVSLGASPQKMRGDDSTNSAVVVHDQNSKKERQVKSFDKNIRHQSLATILKLFNEGALTPQRVSREMKWAFTEKNKKVDGRTFRNFVFTSGPSGLVGANFFPPSTVGEPTYPGGEWVFRFDPILSPQERELLKSHFKDWTSSESSELVDYVGPGGRVSLKKESAGILNSSDQIEVLHLGLLKLHQ